MRRKEECERFIGIGLGLEGSSHLAVRVNNIQSHLSVHRKKWLITSDFTTVPRHPAQ